MKRVVVIADTGWSVHRVHKGVEKALAGSYSFKFHEARHFFLDRFMADFREADVCLTTMNFYSDMIRLFPDDVDRRKIAIVAHGISEQCAIPVNPCGLFTYGVTSEVLVPHFSAKLRVPVHVTPNGVDPSVFSYRVRDGTIKVLGWCGAPGVPVKRIEIARAVAETVGLELRVAATVPREEMAAWYDSIDLLLVTSGPDVTVETGPLPPFEAIVAGVPVIGSPCGNFSFVPGPKFATVEEGVALVRTLMSDPTQVVEVAKDQRESVLKNWTYDALASKWTVLFEAVLAKTSHPVFTVDPTKTTPLCEIMGRYGSDKGSDQINKTEHNYTAVYHRLFEMKRNLPLRVFELGLGTNYTDTPSNMGAAGKPGASLRGWREYFPLSHVFGADIDTRVLFEEERIQTFACDQTNPAMIRDMWSKKELEEDFDIIVEDGLHEFDANVCFFENSVHKVKPDGYFVIEDIYYTIVPALEAKMKEWRTMYPSFEFCLFAIPSKVNKTNNRILIAHNTLPSNRYATIDAHLYINLTHRVDRKDHIEGQLKAANVSAETIHRIDAVYRKGFGSLGCNESHIKALEMALTHPEWTYIAIFEDDFTFRDPAGFRTKVATILQNAKPDVLMLAQGIEELDIVATRLRDIRKVRFAKTTSGYIIHASYIPILLKNFRECRELSVEVGSWKKEYCLDTYWRRLQERDRWYAFIPSIGYQCESYSDITCVTINYSC
jgi:SAM-dependent methyltransferase